MKEAFNKIIDRFGEIELRDWERNQAHLKLRSIGQSNLAFLSSSNGVKKEDYQIWIEARVEQAICKVINQWVSAYKTEYEHNQYFSIKNESLEGVVNSRIVPSRLVRRINLNSASWQQLEKLPGLGTKSAASIIKYRDFYGNFFEKSELHSKKILSKSSYDKVKSYIFVPESTLPSFFITGDLRQFISTRSMDSLFQLYKESHGQFVEGDAEIKDMKTDGEVLLGLLNRIQQELEHSPFLIQRAEATKAMVQAFVERKKKATALNKKTQPISSGALINDSMYMPVILEALKKARSEIKVVMFFFRFVEGSQTYPTAPIMKELVAAKKRGVKVQLILDVDRQDDIYGSSVINDEAYKFLKQNKISVRLDRKKKATHSKIVLIDGEHLYTGSHNWTAGSLYSYDDKSVYLNGKDICAQAGNRFSALWDKSK